MSLILQALKKAEAERSVGRVPTLDQVTAAEPLPAASPHRAWWVGAVGVIAAAAAVAAWWWRDPASTEPVVAAAAALPASAAAPAASPPPMRPDPPTALAPQAPQAPVVRPPVPAPKAAAAASAPSTAAASAAPPPPAPPARPASAAETPWPALHDLPVAVRQALPPLPLGGSIWSPNPAERMLILGGEVRREGDAITPELVLVSIGPRSAVLRWREQSFRLPY